MNISRVSKLIEQRFCHGLHLPGRRRTHLHGRFVSTTAALWNGPKPKSVLTGETIRIGCASGFWGDTICAAPQLVHEGKIDFLVSDYLSEITMSLLTAAKQKNPNLGYAPDFIEAVMAPLIGDIKRKGIRVICNAGGVNPLACGHAVMKVAKDAGIELNVAVVTGDDLMSQMQSIKESGITSMDGNKPFPSKIHSMNAYLGAGPIARALDLGAEVIVTGRCVDSALALAPCMHTFKWKTDDYDLLSAGSLAGHLIECGAQVTGGINTDWQAVPNWNMIGFPIAECASNGKFTISKPPKTGGLVTCSGVAEQLVYEIGDPRQYMLPDVNCDFSQVKLESVIGYDGGAVLVTGATGQAPSNDYKVSATYADGFRATAVSPVGGPFSTQKAERTAVAILKRTRNLFKKLGLEDYTRTHTQVLGAEQTYGPHAKVRVNEGRPREVVLWLAVHHQQKKALEIFAREIAPAGTGMAPGLTGIVGGRPKVSPLLRLYSFLYSKNELQVDIHMNGELVETLPLPPVIAEDTKTKKKESHRPQPKRMAKGSCTFPVSVLAHTRSGDKGDTVNIGVIARHPAYYPFLCASLTTEVITNYFEHILEKGEDGHYKVHRYELPGIHALNFVLENALGGGGVASLRSDPQGKAIGQMLLDYKIKNLPDILPSVVEAKL